MTIFDNFKQGKPEPKANDVIPPSSAPSAPLPSSPSPASVIPVAQRPAPKKIALPGLTKKAQPNAPRDTLHDNSVGNSGTDDPGAPEQDATTGPRKIPVLAKSKTIAAPVGAPVTKISAPGPKVPVPPAPPAPSELTGALGILMQNAEARAAKSTREHDPAYDEISATSAAILDTGEVYDVQELLSDWPDVNDDDDEDAEDRQNERNALIKRAVDRLDTIFATELELLRVAEAIHPVCVEMSRIVKLCFLRIKESPAAYDVLGPENRKNIVRALRVMADKRKMAVEGRKGKKEESALLEGVNMFEEGAFDFDDGDGGGLDLGFGV